MRGILQVGVLSFVVGCGIDPLPTEDCGNGVAESSAGEDCDSGPRLEHADQPVTCAAAGEANACRYVCDHTAVAPGCPAGWGCGTDGICRHASGAYADGGSVSSVTGRLDLADVDGDGRRDLVAVTIDQVSPLFNNGDGTFTAGRIVPAVSPSPAPHIGDLDGDGRADVVTGTFTGFVQTRGQKSRTFLPYAQPTFPISTFGATKSFPFRIGSPQLTNGPITHLFVLDDELGTLRIRVLDQELEDADGLFDEIAPINLGAATIFDVAGSPAHADLDGDDGEEIALAVVGSTSVRVFSPVHDGRFVSDLDLSTVTLPAPADTRGLRLVDVDGDARLDLVVGVDSNRVAVARGLGAGAFGPAVFDGFFESFSGSPFPLAKLQLGASRAWVNDFGIFRDDAGTATLIDFNNAFFWSEVVVGDFNSDGLDDMAATVANKPTLDVFLQTQGNLFAHTRVVTSKIPTNLRVGDFDGDGTTDLAFVESASSGVGPFTVLVSFGSPQGLTTPVSVGVWATVASLESASVFLRAAVFRDGVDDLIVQGTLDPASFTESYTFLFGSYQRVMFAPYEIKDSMGSVVSDHTLVGDYDGDGQADVATLSLDSNATSGIRVDLARGTGGGNLASPTVPLATANVEGSISAFCSRFRTTDFDADFYTDVVGLQASFCVDEASPPQLVVIRVGAAQTRVEQVALPRGMSEFAIGDVDGDGRPDVLVTGFDDTFTAVAAVLFRDDNGFTTVSIPSADPRGLAVVNADDDAAPELVVVGSAGVELFEIDGRELTRKTTVLDGFFGGLVFALDVNGDAVDDLVVQDDLAGELRVFFAIPHDQQVVSALGR